MINQSRLSQQEWRKQKRAARQSLSVSDKQNFSQQIHQRVIDTPQYQSAQNIGAYLAMPEEVDVRSIIQSAWADRKTVYLPIVVAMGQALQFAPYYPESKLIKGALNIEVPDVSDSDCVAASQLDFVVTPLVVFDENCNRIGMGGGFYDRTFAAKDNHSNASFLIGAAFEVQRTNATITANSWDVKPDAIITELGIYQ